MLQSGKLRALPFVAVLTAIVSLACFGLPLYVIWPFRHQGSTELGIALFVKQVGPWLSIFCAAVCVVAVVFVWRNWRGWGVRSIAIVSLVAALAGSVLARLNIYELMFHPIDAAQFESAGSAKLDPEDMLIAIRVNGERRAYPIREMGYHHVVNDTVGGEPVVATY